MADDYDDAPKSQRMKILKKTCARISSLASHGHGAGERGVTSM